MKERRTLAAKRAALDAAMAAIQREKNRRDSERSYLIECLLETRDLLDWWEEKRDLIRHRLAQ